VDAAADRRARLRRSLRLLPLAGVALALVVLYQVVEPVRVPSESMSPTLVPGDHVLVDKLAYSDAQPRRRELVVAHDPTGGGLLLKRVVAVGGDEVGVEDGVLVVNGVPVEETFYDRKTVDGVYFGPLRVPDGRVFLLGDNRGNSVDSREFGAVPVSSLVGRVNLRLWPDPGAL
jgi:signal peptidase I